MTPQELLEKAQTGALTEDEAKQLLEGMNAEMQQLKDEDPQKYLELLRELNDIIGDLNTELKSV